MELIDFLMSLISFCPVDKSGIEIDTTPHIYFKKERDEEQDIGREAEFTVFIISRTENEGKGLFAELQGAIAKGPHNTFYFYKVQWDGDGNNLPDGRYMQEIKLTILYEEE